MPSSNPLERYRALLLVHTHCNLCGADDADRVFSDGPLHLVRCRRCGLVYVTPRLAEGMIRDLYDRGYFQTGNGSVRGYRDYIADQEVYLQTFRKRMRWIETYAGQGGRLLDVGCAAGFFLQVACERGWQVQGVEPAAYVADFARNQLDLDVFDGTLCEAGFPPGSFDVITLWDVLEHLTDPRQTLIETNRVLRKEGLLVLETQNIDSWLPKILGDRWIHFGNDLHLFHFTPLTIARLLTDTGFRVLTITRVTAGKVCTLRFVADKLTHLNRTLSRMADRLLNRWSVLARRSLHINLGDEMIVCARKAVELP